MSDQNQNTPAAEGNTPAAEAQPQFSAAEVASIEAARRGLTEPEGVNTPSAPADGRPEGVPEGVPEQFWKDGKVDVEGLAKSYSELRAKMDAPKTEEAPAKTDAEPPVAADGKIKQDDEKPADETPSPLASAMELARTEYADTQAVSDETVAALEAAGIPRDIFNLYLEGLKAQTTQLVSSIHEMAGGADAYGQATTWAAKNLSADEIAAFNDALDDPMLRETAVSGLMARYQKAVPSEGRPLIPTDQPAATGDTFQSRDELTAAMKDPRYSSDAKYRDEVVAKLARSQRQGFQAFKQPLFQREPLSR